MSKDMCPSDREVESIFRMARESVRFFGGLAGALRTLERAERTQGALLAAWSTNRERRPRGSNGQPPEPAPLGEPPGIFDPVGLAYALHTTMRGDRLAAAPEHAAPEGSPGQSERAPVQNNTVQAAE